MNTEVSAKEEHEPTKGQLQIAKKGNRHAGRFKLDDLSREALRFALEYHISKDLQTSHNVVVRRALRVYRNYLQGIIDPQQEAKELIRAAKGVA